MTARRNWFNPSLRPLLKRIAWDSALYVGLPSTVVASLFMGIYTALGVTEWSGKQLVVLLLFAVTTSLAQQTSRVARYNRFLNPINCVVSLVFCTAMMFTAITTIFFYAGFSGGEGAAVLILGNAFLFGSCLLCFWCIFNSRSTAGRRTDGVHGIYQSLWENYRSSMIS